MAVLDEITAIFKGEKGFERLFSLFLQKYSSYERVEKGISVVLQNPTEVEKRALSGFIGADYSKNKSIRISAEKMEKAILKTKYGKQLEEVSFQDILERYHGKVLVSNREVEEAFLAEREAYFHAFKEQANIALFLRLLEWITNTKSNRFYQLYQHNQQELTAVLKHLEKAFSMFPLEDDEYLAVFASKAAGNPHAFDADENEGKLFLYALQIIYTFENDDWTIKDLNAEERAQMLYHYGIMTDDLLNFVSVFQLAGKNKDGSENGLLAGAVQEQAFFHLPLKEVAKLGEAQSISEVNRLFVIENSSVASHVANELIKDNVEETIVSGNGQFKIATLKLLDIFVAGGGVIYYSGDYDPEGILMAYRLKQRYGDQLVYWKFDVDSYYLSNPVKLVSERRLKQLRTVEDTALEPVIRTLMEERKSGYQESVLMELVGDIKMWK
ncbi:TIGR02679 domain-containing protein [Oceanobacillus locisalsi]|uniref:TIGR02679 domain-containing protein n=1 Tax=Oceanobacillus locisalsi TaxID=546107 RepID=A0ABW3NDB1_9BACI